MCKQATMRVPPLLKKGVCLLLTFVIILGCFSSMVYAEDSGITLNLNNVTGNVTSVSRTITTTDKAKKPKAQASIVYIATVNDGDASITNNTKLKLTATYSSFLNSSGFISMGKTGSKTITDIATGT